MSAEHLNQPPSQDQPRSENIHLNDLEAGDAAAGLNDEDQRSPTPPPGYKEQDMDEPLPPYMARVRMVMRRERPMSYAMPEKKTGVGIFAGFLLIIAIIVAVSVGVSVHNNQNNNNNNTNKK